MDEQTPYDVFIDAFIHRVEEDIDFFTYFLTTEEQAADIATRRATIYMHEAFSRIMMECQPTVNFFDYDDSERVLNFKANGTEILLVSSLMYEAYLSRDIAKIKLRRVDYTSTDLRVFDPSNARTSFMDMYEEVRRENYRLLDVYKNTDRDTHQYVGVDYSAYDFDD